MPLVRANKVTAVLVFDAGSTVTAAEAAQAVEEEINGLIEGLRSRRLGSLRITGNLQSITVDRT